MITLANIIGRMNLYTPINNKDEVLKVNAIDQALRVLRRTIQPTWTLERGTIRLFDGVQEYPLATDHARLAFLDNPVLNDSYAERPRYVYTSIKDFQENATYGNSIAEIWTRGVRYLGVRNKTANTYGSILASPADSVSGWTTSGVAGSPVLDTVFYYDGVSSIRVPITVATGSAEIKTTFSAFSDVNYARKYAFRRVWLDGIPASIQLQFGLDASNYYSSFVTTQFSGIPFRADAWNYLAFDLNTATVTGTPGTNFAFQNVVMVDAPIGTYYFDDSYVRSWTIQDYWYYSKNNVESADGSTRQQYFAPDQATYDLNDFLIGDDDIWADLLAFEAATYLLSDDKEAAIKKDVVELRNGAFQSLFEQYPDLAPQISTTTYNFQTDYQAMMDIGTSL